MANKTRNSKEVTNSIFTGLEEAADHARGKINLRNRKVSLSIAPIPKLTGNDIKNIRTKKLHLTQELLAKAFGVSAKTVEAWESGRNTPQGPSLRLFDILRKDPDAFSEFFQLQDSV